MNFQTIKQSAGPQSLKTTNSRSYVQLQVQGNGILYYGSSIPEITGSQTDATQYRGFQVQSTDGIQRFWINKPLWVVASQDLQLAYDIDDFTD